MIRWDLVARAIEMYQALGYEYIEAPWLVSPAASKSTLPPNREACVLSHAGRARGDLVGSAEQSFVQLMIDGKISPGRWVTAGPCFRWEDTFDDIHHPTFFKVELMDLAIDPDVSRVTSDACLVLSELTGRLVQRVKTPEGYDLEIGGIEVGSYGQRVFCGATWAYGTGLALPRTTFTSKL